MKVGLVACVLSMLGVGGIVGHADASSVSGENSPTLSVLHPKLEKTIYYNGMLGGLLGKAPLIKAIQYSPDGRYLAVEYSPIVSTVDIVVWDLVRNKQQSRIECATTYAQASHANMMWGHDGRTIYFGVRRRWDAMTGAVEPDTTAVGGDALPNKDGSKVLAVMGSFNKPNFIYIYDAKSWQLQSKLDMDGLRIISAAWTADNKVMVSVSAAPNARNKVVDGRTLQWYDVGVRLLDPSGKESPKTIWYPQVASHRVKAIPWEQSADVHLYGTSFAGNQVVLGVGRLIDGRSMRITTYYSDEEIAKKQDLPGIGGRAFTVDGRYMLSKGLAWFDNRAPVVNAIIDTLSGTQVATFGGGDSGIAVSPDGRQIAIGNVRSVQLLSLQ